MAGLLRTKWLQWAERLPHAKARKLYLDLMVKCLTGTIYQDKPLPMPWAADAYSAELRESGLDWPSFAHSMIGVKRMNNLRQLAEAVIAERVPGDFVETGVWRGGASILMRAVLKAHEIRDRRVWLADSFEGLPPPSPDYPADAGELFHEYPELAVSLEDVKANFSRYDLLDDQVVFLKGWFKDTLPSAPIDRIAILRLDGDLYESTMDALNALYDKVSPGGYVIIDDYHVVKGCKQAVHDFMARRNISPTIEEIDNVGVFWSVAR